MAIRTYERSYAFLRYFFSFVSVPFSLGLSVYHHHCPSVSLPLLPVIPRRCLYSLAFFFFFFRFLFTRRRDDSRMNQRIRCNNLPVFSHGAESLREVFPRLKCGRYMQSKVLLNSKYTRRALYALCAQGIALLSSIRHDTPLY